MDDELSGVNKTARTADRVAGLAYGALHPPVAHDRLSCMDIGIGVSSVGFRIARSLDLHIAFQGIGWANHPGVGQPMPACRGTPGLRNTDIAAAGGRRRSSPDRHPDCGYPGQRRDNGSRLVSVLPSQDCEHPG